MQLTLCGSVVLRELFIVSYLFLSAIKKIRQIRHLHQMGVPGLLLAIFNQQHVTSYLKITLYIVFIEYYETLKHSDFITEPMGDKLVTEVPGIGDVTAEHMKKKGIKKAKHLYGIWLHPGPQTFRDQVRAFGANRAQVEHAAEAMKDWDAQNN